jgi:drug/metabolite transporter (DMT)-like permease
MRRAGRRHASERMNLGALYGFLAVSIFSAQAVAAHFAVKAGLTTIDLAVLRYVFSGVVLLPALVWMLRRRPFGIPLRRYAILALMAGPLYVTAFIGAMVFAPATHSALIFPALTPVFTAMIARRALAQESMSTLALTLLVTGVLCAKLDTFTSLTHNDAATLLGDLLLAGTALCWAGYTVLLRRWNVPIVDGVIGVQLSGLPVAIAYLWFVDTAIWHASWTAVAVQGVYFGLCVGVLGSVFFTLSVRLLGAKAQMFVALTPMMGLGLAVAVLGEPMTPMLWVGSALVVAGLGVSLAKRSGVTTATR